MGRDAPAFWSVDSMTRISPHTPPRAVDEIHLHACRNATEAFQLVVTATDSIQKQSRIIVSAWKGPESPSVPHTSLFQEHFVRVTTSSPNAPLPPGDYPDPLVPSASGQYLKFPTDPPLSSDSPSNQPWWVDVQVTTDTTPGDYHATVSLRTATELRSIPLTLTVWPITLPTRPTLRSSFVAHWGRVAEIHGLARDGQDPGLRALTTQYHQLLAEHRITADSLDPLMDLATDGTIRSMSVKEFEDRFEKQHATSLPVPMSATWPFADPLGKDRESAIRFLASFMKVMKLHGWERFCFLDCPVDEPDSAAAYEEVRGWGSLCDQASRSCGIRLPLLCTEQPLPSKPEWGSLVGAVNIWVPNLGEFWHSPHQPDPSILINQRQAAGDEVWTYVAMVQYPKNFPRNVSDHPIDHHPCFWLLDYAPMNFRITSWLCAANDWQGLLYWDTLHWPSGTDPWRDPATFREGTTVYNGDGCLMYPTTHGPVPSLRLKWLRASFEDHALIQLARESGLGDFTDQQVRGIARGVADWDADPARLLNARHRIGETLAGHIKRVLYSEPSAHNPKSSEPRSR